jgi:hypothetical protein
MNRRTAIGTADEDSYLASRPQLFEERTVERIIERPRLPPDKCQRCWHARSDHKVETEKRHPHFRTVAGDMRGKMFPTMNRDPYCHQTLCTCMWFAEFGEVPVSSFGTRWIKENGL